MAPDGDPHGQVTDYSIQLKLLTQRLVAIEAEVRPTKPRLAPDGYLGSLIADHEIQLRAFGNELTELRKRVNGLETQMIRIGGDDNV